MIASYASIGIRRIYTYGCVEGFLTPDYLGYRAMPRYEVVFTAGIKVPHPQKS